MTNKFFSILILLLGVGFSFQCKAQISATATMDTNLLLIGDQTKVTLEATVPGNYLVEFPIFKDTIIDKLEILDILSTDTAIVNNLLQIKQQYLVTIFDSGWYVIPPIKITISDTLTNVQDSLFTSPIYFGVMTMPLDTVQVDAINDIKDPIDAPLTLREVLPFVGIGLGILLILFLSYYLYMRLARKEPVFVRKEKPKEPAHLIAFRDLDNLKESKLWQQGKNKAYYSQLTDIIRTYLENRYGIFAMEMTTDEIMHELAVQKVLDKEIKDNLFDVLTTADFVKFAKATTLANENEASIKFAYEFVIKTKLEVVLNDDKDSTAELDVEQKAK